MNPWLCSFLGHPASLKTLWVGDEGCWRLRCSCEQSAELVRHFCKKPEECRFKHSSIWTFTDKK